MGSNKMLYIPERDEPLWQAAQRVADLHEVSLYSVIRDALTDHLPRIATKPTPAERWSQLASKPEARKA